MPSLQVRDLPEPIYQKLKLLAEQEHRTLAQQAIVALARGLDIPLDAISRRKKLLVEIDKIADENAKYKLSDPVKLIREDRDR